MLTVDEDEQRRRSVRVGRQVDIARSSRVLQPLVRDVEASSVFRSHRSGPESGEKTRAKEHDDRRSVRRFGRLSMPAPSSREHDEHGVRALHRDKYFAFLAKYLSG